MYITEWKFVSPNLLYLCSIEIFICIIHIDLNDVCFSKAFVFRKKVGLREKSTLFEKSTFLCTWWFWRCGPMRLDLFHYFRLVIIPANYFFNSIWLFIVVWIGVCSLIIIYNLIETNTFARKVSRLNLISW